MWGPHQSAWVAPAQLCASIRAISRLSHSTALGY
jgi:hypothetical protein